MLGASDGPPDALLDDLMRAPPTLGQGRLLCIDGPAGSGKTTLAARIAQDLTDRRIGVQVIHCDDLYAGWSGLEGLDVRLRDQLLRPLDAGRCGRYRRWDWARSQWWPGWVSVPATDVLVIEGVGAGNASCAQFCTALIWVDAAEPLRKQRALTRADDDFGSHWDDWTAGEAAYFASDRPAERASVRYGSDLTG